MRGGVRPRFGGVVGLPAGKVLWPRGEPRLEPLYGEGLCATGGLVLRTVEYLFGDGLA